MASAQSTPGLDETSFQQMLEAAYVLQEGGELPAPSHPALDPAETLAEIAATQELLRSKDTDLHASGRLIAERLQKITNATGVAVALIHEDQLEYAAAVGNAASLAGMAMPIDSSLSEFLQTAAADPALISQLLKRHNSRAPFLFPVYHEGRVAGLLDVRFAECEAITAKDVQSCQVMAGLLGKRSPEPPRWNGSKPWQPNEPPCWKCWNACDLNWSVSRRNLRQQLPQE